MPTASLISVEEARARVLAAVPRRLDRERTAIELALDRVLASPVLAGADMPPCPVSAMDGYALPECAPGTPGRELRVLGESRAGHPFTGRLAAGQAVRISTGAAVPEGTVAVVRQEDTTLSGDGRLTLSTTPSAGANIRAAGEQMRAGEPVLEAGVRLGPAELAVAVTAGASRLELARRPRVSIVCTGDELRPPGEPLGPGEIHNSNAVLLASLATRAGALIGVSDHASDDAEQTERALGGALAGCDVLLVSGGVSVGPHDHVKPALERLGVEPRFWGVALQPGKPTWFGVRGSTLVFGLPGNPVSAAVTFSLFVRPALDALMSAVPEAPPVPSARLAVAVRRNPEREQAIRVKLRFDAGIVEACPTGDQSSHLMSSLLRADALALVPAGADELAIGETVRLTPLPR